MRSSSSATGRRPPPWQSFSWPYRRWRSLCSSCPASPRPGRDAALALSDPLAAGGGGVPVPARSQRVKKRERRVTAGRSEEHTSELHSPNHLLFPPLLLKKK